MAVKIVREQATRRKAVNIYSVLQKKVSIYTFSSSLTTEIIQHYRITFLEKYPEDPKNLDVHKRSNRDFEFSSNASTIILCLLYRPTRAGPFYETI
jgi:hypothetical protein